MFLFHSSSLEWLLVPNNVSYVHSAALFGPRSWGEALLWAKRSDNGLTFYCSEGKWVVKRWNEFVFWLVGLLRRPSFELPAPSRRWGPHGAQGEAERNWACSASRGDCFCWTEAIKVEPGSSQMRSNRQKLQRGKLQLDLKNPLWRWWDRGRVSPEVV